MNGRRFEGETFEGLVRRDCVLEGCAFYDCVFLRCTLENVRLVGCTFSGCTFNGCRVSELQTLHSTVSLAVLENCALVGVDWSRLLPAGMFAEPIAAMRACRLKYNSFFKMAFRGFDFTGSGSDRLQFRRIRDFRLRLAGLPAGPHRVFPLRPAPVGFPRRHRLPD